MTGGRPMADSTRSRFRMLLCRLLLMVWTCRRGSIMYKQCGSEHDKGGGMLRTGHRNAGAP